MHKSKWARNISLNILDNNFDNDIVLKDFFSDNLTKEEKYEEAHVSNSEKSKDMSIDNFNSILQLKNMRLKDINRTIIGSLNINTYIDLFLTKQFIFSTYRDCQQVCLIFKHAPRKTKILRANHSSHVSKALRKAIMKRLYCILKNYILKTEQKIH